jgi:hypothetical protein
MGITKCLHSSKEIFGEEFESIENMAKEILDNRDLKKRPNSDLIKVMSTFYFE